MFVNLYSLSSTKSSSGNIYAKILNIIFLWRQDLPLDFKVHNWEIKQKLFTKIIGTPKVLITRPLHSRIVYFKGTLAFRKWSPIGIR